VGIWHLTKEPTNQRITMSSSVAILNVQSALTLAAQSYARSVVAVLAAKWGVSEEVLAAGLAEVGLAGVPVAVAEAEGKTGKRKLSRKSKAEGSDAGSVTSEKSNRGGWKTMSEEQKAERMAKMRAGKEAAKAAKAAKAVAEPAEVAPVAAPAAPVAAPVAPASPVAAPASPVSSEGKSKRGGWDKLTPEQKAERAAKMQAGRKANAAAKAAAAAPAVTPAPVAAPAPAPAPVAVAAPAPAPAPVAEETATEVEEVVIKGVTYLRSPEGFLFDPATEEPVGYFNAETGEIEEVETD
jgi:hypothetical protein